MVKVLGNPRKQEKFRATPGSEQSSGKWEEIWVSLSNE